MRMEAVADRRSLVVGVTLGLLWVSRVGHWLPGAAAQVISVWAAATADGAIGRLQVTSKPAPPSAHPDMLGRVLLPLRASLGFRFCFACLQKLRRALLQRQPRDQVIQMINGYWVSQICGAVARLGLADRLADGPATIGELAAATSASPDGLCRLLRAGTSVGLFAEADTGRFMLTPLGAQLRDDEAAGSLRDRAIALTAPAHWLPWGLLFDAVVSGESQANAALGMDAWAYYAGHPEESAHFARTMSDISAQASRAVLRCWDVARFRRIVDVGGSRGHLLTGLLDAEPQATSVLFDRPEVVEGARVELAASGHAHRVEIVGGDFFERVPSGGDLYVLKSVLHDWDDERALQILRNIHQAAQPGSTLAVIERPLPSRPRPSYMHLENLLMLVELKGRERTIEDYASLLGRAGFRLQRTIAATGSGLRSPWTVMEAIRQ